MGNWRWLILFVVTLLSLTDPVTAHGEESIESHETITRLHGDRGEPLMTTGLRLHVGDRYIAADNMEWVVHSVSQGEAVASRRGRVSLHPTERELSLLRQEPQAMQTSAGSEGPVDVVVYHTHSDESYIPTDKTDTIDGQGGIYRVGASLVDRLKELGVSAVQRPENHNPRDRGAYVRSRRTVVDAMAVQTPAVIFDVHRDAAPGSEYDFEVAGKKTSKVMVVIGGSNPAHEGNLAFAKLMKERADVTYPGLVKGIYVGQGNYNQDIYARNILLEVGSQETPGDRAESGIAFLGSAIAPLVHELELPASPPVQAEGRAAWRTIGWWVVALGLIGFGWLSLNSGGVQPALHRLGQLPNRFWSQLKRR